MLTTTKTFIVKVGIIARTHKLRCRGVKKNLDKKLKKARDDIFLSERENTKRLEKLVHLKSTIHDLSSSFEKAEKRVTF